MAAGVAARTRRSSHDPNRAVPLWIGIHLGERRAKNARRLPLHRQQTPHGQCIRHIRILLAVRRDGKQRRNVGLCGSWQGRRWGEPLLQDMRDNAVLVHGGATASDWHRWWLFSGRKSWRTDHFSQTCPKAALGRATRLLEGGRMRVDVQTVTPRSPPCANRDADARSGSQAWLTRPHTTRYIQGARQGWQTKVAAERRACGLGGAPTALRQASENMHFKPRCFSKASKSRSLCSKRWPLTMHRVASTTSIVPRTVTPSWRSFR